MFFCHQFFSYDISLVTGYLFPASKKIAYAPWGLYIVLIDCIFVFSKPTSCVSFISSYLVCATNIIFAYILVGIFF